MATYSLNSVCLRNCYAEKVVHWMLPICVQLQEMMYLI